ncbi:hypothetical protein FVE85_7381 [Porphyridium purpureum]|uniref:Wings apart-like protein C-terminal domain-containing protein n=1 Tax=Porphyridium purpureum TaxID=35688 RepID=A0A5J4Z7S8_PORPP|nr:hypothetical protein FVE85_7381 [Porphyridium purpureum]|eukprot:POR0738..scf295_1
MRKRYNDHAHFGAGFDVDFQQPGSFAGADDADEQHGQRNGQLRPRTRRRTVKRSILSSNTSSGASRENSLSQGGGRSGGANAHIGPTATKPRSGQDVDDSSLQHAKRAGIKRSILSGAGESQPTGSGDQNIHGAFNPQEPTKGASTKEMFDQGTEAPARKRKLKRGLSRQSERSVPGSSSDAGIESTNDILLGRRYIISSSGPPKRASETDFMMPARALGKSQALLDELQYAIDGLSLPAERKDVKGLAAVQQKSLIALSLLCCGQDKLELIHKHNLLRPLVEVVHKLSRLLEIKNTAPDERVVVFLFFYVLALDPNFVAHFSASDLLAISARYCDDITSGRRVTSGDMDSSVLGVLQTELGRMDEVHESSLHARSMCEAFEADPSCYILVQGVVMRTLSRSDRARASLRQTRILTAMMDHLCCVLDKIPTKPSLRQPAASSMFDILATLSSIESALLFRRNQDFFILYSESKLSLLGGSLSIHDWPVQIGILRLLLNASFCSAAASDALASAGLIRDLMKLLAACCADRSQCEYDVLVLCSSLLASIAEQVTDVAMIAPFANEAEWSDLLVRLVLSDADSAARASMEDRVALGYTALLIGVLMRRSPEVSEKMGCLLQPVQLLQLADLLEEFWAFQIDLGIDSEPTRKMYSSAIEHLHGT